MRSLAYLVTILFLLSHGQGFATDVEYSAALEAAYYSNINQLNVSPGEEISETLRGELSVREDTVELNANLDMQIAAINFENDQSDNEVTYSLLADALISLEPNRFEWYVSEIYTQTPIDTLVGDISANRQYANAFSTGPNYIIRINRTNLLTLEARVGDYQYEINNADNNRGSVNAIWALSISPYFNLSTNLELESVVFSSDAIYEDYERINFLFSGRYVRGFSTYEGEIGQTVINYQDSESSDELVYSFSVETSRTSSSRLRLEVGRSIFDTASVLEYQIGEDVQFYNYSTTSSDLYASEMLMLGYNQEVSQGSYQLQLSSESNRYDRQVLENIDRLGGIFRYERNVGRTSNIALEARAFNLKRVSTIPQQKVRDYFYGITYRYDIRRNVVLSFQATQQTRDSAIETEDYEDERFIVSLIYSSL